MFNYYKFRTVKISCKPEYLNCVPTFVCNPAELNRYLANCEAIISNFYDAPNPNTFKMGFNAKRDLYRKVTLKTLLYGLRELFGTVIRCTRPKSLVIQRENVNIFNVIIQNLQNLGKIITIINSLITVTSNEMPFQFSVGNVWKLIFDPKSWGFVLLHWTRLFWMVCFKFIYFFPIYSSWM